MKENGIRYDRSKMSSFVHESTHDIRKNMCREEEKERIKLEDFIDGDSKRGRGREGEGERESVCTYCGKWLRKLDWRRWLSLWLL